MNPSNQKENASAVGMIENAPSLETLEIVRSFTYLNLLLFCTSKKKSFAMYV
jgi:hypothetical protein